MMRKRHPPKISYFFFEKISKFSQTYEEEKNKMVRGGGWMMALETGDEMNKRRLFILKKKGLRREYIINPT